MLRRILIFASNTNQKLNPTEFGRILNDFAPIVSKLLSDGIKLEVEAPPDLPMILADVGDLQQVMINLCLNARDAMPGCGTLRLAAAAVSLSPTEARFVGADATDGDFLALSVRDTGTGIAPEIRGQLFDPFFTTKPRETATGLGLATVLKAMRRHDGFVGYETEVGAVRVSPATFRPSTGRARLKEAHGRQDLRLCRLTPCLHSVL